jgi:pimeloyl-ACP methyl ester carboxylesterase
MVMNRNVRWQVPSIQRLLQGGICLLLVCICLMPMPAVAADSQALRKVTCWFKVPSDHTASCYRLAVPETRKTGNTAGGGSAGNAPPVMMLDLPVVVISTPSARQHADPVVYISGGPGDGDWVDSDRIGYWWQFLADNPWMQHRDLILFDQRGVGLTEPRVDCPEVAALNVASLAFGNDHQRATALGLAAAGACLSRLTQEGHDAGAYTTEASAADLHDIFTALGVPRWNIYGLSYGTRLALTYMRLHAGDIRTAILDSVYPPEVKFLEDDAWRTDRAFRLLFEACARDHDCNAWYPDLARRLQALVERLNAKPLLMHRRNPDDKADLAFPVTGETLLTHLFFNLYNRDDLERIPQIIDVFEHNQADAVAREIDLLVEELHDRPDWGDAMAATIDCLEDVPFNDPAKVEANYAASPLLRSYSDMDPAGFCPAWVKRPPAAAMAQPVDSEVPSLVLAGINDPVTPPSYAHLAASHLRNAFYLEFRAIGHDVLGNSLCAGRLAEDFLDQPNRAPGDACFGKLPDFKFDRPIDQ